MALWYETPDDQKDAYHWLQVALSLARRAGLDRNPDALDLPPSERHIRKRLWWCCLIRDPLLALGLKRPISILPQDHNVPDLTINDWGYKTDRRGLSMLGLDWNLEKLRLLWSTCIAEAKLHQCLREILSKQYTMGDCQRGRPVRDETTTNRILLPDSSNQARSTVMHCEKGLQRWHEDLPTTLSSTAISPEFDDSKFEAFVVYRTVLHMLYHTCLITLYRPWVKSSESPLIASFTRDEDEFCRKAKNAVRMSARCITHLAMELHTADLARHLPQTGISALVAAVVSHISDMASSHEALRASGLRGFEQCSQILNELRDNYYSADFSSDFVNLMVKARRLVNGPLQSSPIRDSIVQSFDFNYQPSEHNTFRAEAEIDATASAPPILGTLPEALFPQGTDLSLNLPLDEDNVLDLERCNDIEIEDRNQSTKLFDTAESWEYYRNLREESTRLLGDFFDEYQLESFGMDPVTLP